MEIYLDAASTVPPHAAARQAISEATGLFGDPLRPHESGRRTRDALETARQELADGIGAQADEVVLTSGGTESVALALTGVTRASGAAGGRIVVSAVEHPCVFAAGGSLASQGFDLVRIPVDPTGRLDLDAFIAEVRRPGTILASVQHANHEVGTLQPVAEAARLAREAGVWFHTDACQSVGRLPIDVDALGVDLLTLSAHKFGGPAGAGALFARRGVPLSGAPGGDDRERHRRAGMENILGAIGMAAAFRTASEELRDQAALQWDLTNRLRAELERTVEGVDLHGHPTQRAPHLVCLSIRDIDPEVVLMALDDRGYRVGGGGIDSGLAHAISPVLAAMGVEGRSSLRIGVSRLTTQDDIDRLLHDLPGLVSELRRMEAASSDTLHRIRQAPSD